jgi:hypothetical protein
MNNDLFHGLVLQRNLLCSLNQEFIQSEDIESTGKQLLSLKSHISSSLTAMFDINPADYTLYEFSQIFKSYLDFEKHTYRHWVRHSRRLFARIKLDEHINFFSRSSCTVFVSLLDPIGLILKVTSQVKELFGYY